MIKEDDILTDADVAKLAGLSLYSFQARMRDGIRSGEIDWFAARPMTLGGRRRWLRQDVEKVIRERIIKE